MPKPTDVVRIGVGAGFADDRIEPAIDLVERADLDFLVFECLAERTTARESLTRRHHPEKGYNPRLIERMERILPLCLERHVRIVTNMGAANPGGGARAVRQMAAEQGLGNVPVAVVEGDDIESIIRAMPELKIMETGEPVETLLPNMVAAHAYLGAEVVCRGLETGAPLVITGRVSDPSLFLAPAMHYWKWSPDDLPRLAAGTVAGHLLECSGQLTGGCFADPGMKDVPDLAHLGNPYADITLAGGVELGKCPDTGGRLDRATATEQLLYEMHDPAAYITPDCVLDVTGVELHEPGPDRVRVTGAQARPHTDTYKVSIGYQDGFIGEGQVSYAGINAVARAKLAAEIIQQRLRENPYTYTEMRVDLIGMSSLHGREPDGPEPYEVRLRVAARCDSRAAAGQVGFETRAMHVNGPSGGGGGIDPIVREILAVQSVLLPRHLVKPRIYVEGAA
ncbi:MAG: DUF1446 domain-containing protein [Proteobacteria bacterium]|nr:DUF1446 domain-containing protein [Pseudomonadota bacterium]